VSWRLEEVRSESGGGEGKRGEGEDGKEEE
jgi:hypothetical protein